MTRRRRSLLGLLVLTSVWLLSGCGNDRTVSPQGVSSSGATSGSIQFLRLPAEAQPLGWGHHPQSASLFVRSAVGGQVRCGRYTLTIPPGALPQDTTITIQDPRDGILHCQLQPHGIQFLVPVQLQMDLSGIIVNPYRDWTIYWHNDATNDWEDQHAVFTPFTLTANLHHFSDYDGGRGGW